MTDREELLYLTGRALCHSREAAEEQEAADQAHSTPEAAANAHRTTAELLDALILRLQTLRDQHAFQTKRMEHAQRRETATGQEYRAGDAA